MHTLILGAGFSGTHIARKALETGTVCGTRRSLEGLAELAAQGIPGCRLDAEQGHDDALLQQLEKTTHLVVSVAPERELPLKDPMLRLLAGLDKPATRLPNLQWIAYLSTIGVYGDHQGRWVDEQTPCTSRQQRSLARREAEIAWQAFAQSRAVPVSVLRLSGIYGPGRNAVKDALAGRDHLLIKPGQVFNRIHVEDLAAATMKAGVQRYHGLLNITDDEPAPPQDVIRHAHSLVDMPEPLAQDFATADISAMARSFYSENKRVSNTKSKSALSLQYRYPSYREGLDAIWESLKNSRRGSSNFSRD